MYDVELIESWTPKEYRLFIKGAQLRNIDEYESKVKQAMWTASATNGGKKVKEKKLFDAEKARKMLDDGYKKKVQAEKQRLLKLNETMKGVTFNPQLHFKPKGGS